MICSGDEFSQSHQGNNNCYCQDNELTWIDWNLDHRQEEFLRFAKRCIALWKSQPVLQRRQFFQGRPIRGGGIRDIVWMTPAGREMTDDDWNRWYVRCLGMRLAGDMENEVDDRGRKIVGDTLLILFNSHHEDHSISPAPARGRRILASVARYGPRAAVSQTLGGRVVSAPGPFDGGVETAANSHAAVENITGATGTQPRAAMTRPQVTAPPRRAQVAAYKKMLDLLRKNSAAIKRRKSAH